MTTVLAGQWMRHISPRLLACWLHVCAGELEFHAAHAASLEKELNTSIGGALVAGAGAADVCGAARGLRCTGVCALARDRHGAVWTAPCRIAWHPLHPGLQRQTT